MYVGSSEDILRQDPVTRSRGKAQLVFTSPPFALGRKKKYGNLSGQEYIDWLVDFGALLRDYLTEDGSMVIELGNSWEPKKPTMSTVPMEALLALKKACDLNLCQEFIYYNPAKLPTPAQWVNVKRTRLKDAFTRIWWLSPNEQPKADNKRVLQRYSESMKKLLARGTYNAGPRPSEHVIGAASFLTDHGGAIPPNVLMPSLSDIVIQAVETAIVGSSLLPVANTGNNDSYQKYCRQHGIQSHPARMPTSLARFFIDLLTDPGDLVIDPFAGSNTTGYAAERARRKWIAVELNEEYANASRVRFRQKAPTLL